MKIDIFIKSYHKDFKLLKYALQSIKKYVSGYRNIVLLIPENEKHLFDIADLPNNTLIHYVKEYGNLYLFQQVCKLNAYLYSDAEFILFSDSDNIFNKHIDAISITNNGKPEILYTNYSQLTDAICWKQPTEDFMHTPVHYEFMRRLPLTYHRSTLENIAKENPNLEHTIMNSQRFSEFNVIGAYAFEYEKEKYSFVNTDDWEYTDPISTQLWSHGKKDGTDLEKQEYQRSVETINKLLQLNITEL